MKITLLCIILLVLSGCQIWKIVKMQGTYTSDVSAAAVDLPNCEANVRSNLLVVATKHGLVPYNCYSDGSNVTFFISTNYNGNFGLSFRRATTNRFEITISESPAFRRSKLSQIIEADLKERISHLQVTNE